MRIVVYSMPVVAIVVIASSLTIQWFEPRNPTENIPPLPEGAAIFNKMRQKKQETKNISAPKQNTGARHQGPAPVFY